MVEDPSSSVRVLLVGGSEGTHAHLRALLSEGPPWTLDHAPTVEGGLRSIERIQYAACLVEVADGAPESGVDFVRRAVAAGCAIPLVGLCAERSHAVEKELCTAGATDCLNARTLDAEHLARALRYAIANHRAFATLREREGLFRAVFAAARDAVLIIDDEARYIDGNPAALELLGVTRRELLRSRVGDYALPHQRAQFDEGWRRFLRGERDTGQWELVRPDGQHRLVEFSSVPHILPNRHLSVLRDVTDRHRLEVTRMRLAAIVESAQDAIFSTDPLGIIREWNPSAERIYGCPAAQAIGQPLTRFVPEERLAELQEMHAAVLRGAHVQALETVRRRPDGSRVDVSLTVSPLRNPEGHVIGMSTIARDVTETKKLRFQLAVADRMASIGAVAAGVAHEINNPLAVVIANLDFVVQAVAKTEGRATDPDPIGARAIVDALRDACDASLRMRDIVADLKSFSRPEQPTTVPVDVQRSIESALRLMSNEIRQRARLVRRYAPALPAVDAHEGQLGQVFLNLLVNAVQAIPEGDPERHEIRVVTRLEDQRVIVEISDTGCGIAPDHAARIFEPFYTTRPAVGTGLGLSICQRIVTSLGGEISLVSVPRMGATFRVSLPAGALAIDRSEPSIALPPRRGRVLVVDEDPSFGRAVRTALAAHHDVDYVTETSEALRRIQARAADVVLCDVMMPGASAMELYAEVQSDVPEMASKIIFTTGTVFAPRARRFLAEISNPRLEKPLDIPALLAALARLL